MKNYIYPTIAIILFLAFWEIIVNIFQIDPIILPSPIRIFQTMIDKWNTLLINSLNTLWGAFLGFIIAFAFVVFFAVVFQFSGLVKKSLLPFVLAMRAIPPIAIAPIVVLWFGTDILSKTLLSAFIAFSPILINLIKGLNNIDEEVLDLMKTFSASKWQVFCKIRIPYSLPDLLAGLKIASSFAVIGAIISEYIGVTKGIGYIIKSSTYYSSTDLTFAAIFAAAIIGLVFYWVIELIEKKIIFWNLRT